MPSDPAGICNLLTPPLVFAWSTGAANSERGRNSEATQCPLDP